MSKDWAIPANLEVFQAEGNGNTATLYQNDSNLSTALNTARTQVTAANSEVRDLEAQVNNIQTRLNMAEAAPHPGQTLGPHPPLPPAIAVE